jgi:hypothetical protein
MFFSRGKKKVKRVEVTRGGYNGKGDVAGNNLKPACNDLLLSFTIPTPL